MAKIECKCGKLLWNGESPNEVQLWVYTDREWNSILEKDVFEAWNVPFPSNDVWRCAQCERIYVFPKKADENGRRTAIKVYKLEE
jgi:hypothetical protein